MFIVLTPDGTAAHAIEAEAPEAEAETLGAALGHQLRERMGPGFLDVKPGA